jgi:hypothetical protein
VISAIGELDRVGYEYHAENTIGGVDVLRDMSAELAFRECPDDEAAPTAACAPVREVGALTDGANADAGIVYLVQVASGKLRGWYLGGGDETWCLVLRRHDAAAFASARAAANGWVRAGGREIVGRLLRQAGFQIVPAGG